MAERTEIHSFACKYYELYKKPQTKEIEVDLGFAECCFALGFEMDSGTRFIENYSLDAFSKSEKLAKIIIDINDANLLGSAIFSKWRDLTHWTCSSLVNDENRKWFILAFARLATITG